MNMKTESSLYLIYVFSNPAMPDLLLIGEIFPRCLTNELNDLHGPGVPGCLYCEYAGITPDKMALAKIYDRYDDYQYQVGSRYFWLDLHQLRPILKRLCERDATTAVRAIMEGNGYVNEVTDRDRAAMKKRKPRMLFDLLGLKIGDKLSYIKNSRIKVTVTTDSRVIHRKKTVSLPEITAELTGTICKQPLDYWLYDGCKLSEIWNDVMSKW